MFAAVIWTPQIHSLTQSDSLTLRSCLTQNCAIAPSRCHGRSLTDSRTPTQSGWILLKPNCYRNKNMFNLTAAFLYKIQVNTVCTKEGENRLSIMAKQEINYIMLHVPFSALSLNLERQHFLSNILILLYLFQKAQDQLSSIKKKDLGTNLD